MKLHYLFNKRFCDADKYGGIEMDTDSLELTLSEESLEDEILLEKQSDCNAMPSGCCTDTFTANATEIFFPQNVLHYAQETR